MQLQTQYAICQIQYSMDSAYIIYGAQHTYDKFTTFNIIIIIHKLIFAKSNTK